MWERVPRAVETFALTDLVLEQLAMEGVGGSGWVRVGGGEGGRQGVCGVCCIVSHTVTVATFFACVLIGAQT